MGVRGVFDCFEVGECARDGRGSMLVRGGLRLVDEVRAMEARVGVINELRIAGLVRVTAGFEALFSPTV